MINRVLEDEIVGWYLKVELVPRVLLIVFEDLCWGSMSIGFGSYLCDKPFNRWSNGMNLFSLHSQ